MDIESLFKATLKNSGVLLSGSLASNVLTFFSLSIMASSLGVKVFGAVVVVQAFVEILDKTFNFQTWQAFIRFASISKFSNERRLNLMGLGKIGLVLDCLSLLLSIFVGLICLEYFLELLGVSSVYHYYAEMLIVALLFKALDSSIGFFRFYGEFKLLSMLVFIGALIKLILFLAVSVLSPGVAEFVFSIIAVQAITCFLKGMFLVRTLNRHGFSLFILLGAKLDFRILHSVKYFSFVLYNNLDISIRGVSRNLDIFLLGKFFGTEVVGLYKVAREVSAVVGKAVDPIYQVVYPEFSRMLAAGCKRESVAFAIKISTLLGLISGVGYTLFVLFGRYAIELVFGSEYTSSYSISLLYLVATFVSVVTTCLYPLQHAFGYAKEAFINQLVATLLYVPLCFFLLTKWSAYGASVSYILYYLILTVLVFGSVRRGFQGG